MKPARAGEMASGSVSIKSGITKETKERRNIIGVKKTRKNMDHLLTKYPFKKKQLLPYRIVQRFNCGHIRATKHPNPATIYNWDVHENDEIVHYPQQTSYNIHACDLIEVYQERKSIKRYYIIKGESLPVTETP